MRNRSAAAHPHRILRAMATLSSHAHARVGLLGNPSDLYGGKGLGFAVAELRATVTLAPPLRAAFMPEVPHAS